MSIRLLRGRTSFGRPLRGRGRRRVSSRRRDPQRHSSDEVWSLVERMMEGDTDAAVVLADVIEEGVSGGNTRFVKITSRAFRRGGTQYPGKVVPNHFAAITPGRSIILFGAERVWGPSGGPTLRGYVRRFKTGDIAEYDSYNLSYLGNISKITPQRITIEDRHGERVWRKKTLDIQQFDTRNWDLNVEETVRRNQETSRYI